MSAERLTRLLITVSVSRQLDTDFDAIRELIFASGRKKVKAVRAQVVGQRAVSALVAPGANANGSEHMDYDGLAKSEECRA